jgi:hypothetical protein
VLFCVGAILVVTGIVVSLYTDYMIDGLTVERYSGNLSDEQKWAYDGALKWWTDNRTMLNSLSMIMIALGLVFIIYSFILALQPS